MDITVPISLDDVTARLRVCKSTRLFAAVTVHRCRIKDLRIPGTFLWFEYHCNESYDSPDAEIWYRSHQQVLVLGFANCDPPSFTTVNERAYAGMLLLYRVRFNDGLEWDVFEDELLNSPEEFVRPNPPKPRTEYK